MKSFSIILLLALSLASCNLEQDQQQRSDSGISKATVAVKTDANGHTAEQNNIMRRVIDDNEIGAIKHLYIISTQTGAVMEYSTVVGKVTSGGKRLSPKTVASGESQYAPDNFVTIGGNNYKTAEVLDENGTYGESANYVFWFDAQGNQHQYFPSGGSYLHISSRPLTVHKSDLAVSMNMDTTGRK